MRCCKTTLSRILLLCRLKPVQIRISGLGDNQAPLASQRLNVITI